MCSKCHMKSYRTQYLLIGHARQAPDRSDSIDASVVPPGSAPFRARRAGVGDALPSMRNDVPTRGYAPGSKISSGTTTSQRSHLSRPGTRARRRRGSRSRRHGRRRRRNVLIEKQVALRIDRPAIWSHRANARRGVACNGVAPSGTNRQSTGSDHRKSHAPIREFSKDFGRLTTAPNAPGSWLRSARQYSDSPPRGPEDPRQQSPRSRVP